MSLPLQLGTLEYQPRKGWTAAFPTELDSPRSLVLAFGSSAFLDEPGPLRELSQAFPNACVVGCSTGLASCDLHNQTMTLTTLSEQP